LIEYEGVKIKGQIWDTAGQDRFRAIAAAYYRGAHGALIVYDITNQTSFQNLDSWFKEIENQGEKNCINILVGNKCDLKDQRQVDIEEGKKFAKEHNIRFLETSAADNTNVDLVFTSLLQDIYNHQKTNMKNDDDDDNISAPDPFARGIRLDEAKTPTKKESNCGC
jgi:Ras-related protein Rab-11A